MSIRWIPLLTALLVLGVWALPGCRTDEAETVVIEDDLLEDPDPADEGPADDDAVGDEPADDEQPEEDPVAELPEEEVEPLPQVELDLDREYPHDAFEHLRSILWTGSEAHQEEAHRILQTLLLESRRTNTRTMAAGILAVDPDPAVDALRTAALTDTESQVRRAALESLADASPSPELFTALDQLERAEDSEVRFTAMTTNMELRLRDPEMRYDTDWIERMLATHRDDAAAQMQIRLVVAGPEVLPPLYEILAEGENAHARSGAAAAIMCIAAGTSPQQQRFARLSRALQQEGLPEPQPAITEAVGPLEDALVNDPAAIVRAVAAQGLGYLGEESSGPLLGDAVHDENEEVRFWAARALETIPPEPAAEDLARAATRDASQRVRRAAVRALGWVSREKAVLPLVRATADESSAVRQAAAEELGRFRDSRSLQALTALFNDPNEDVRWAAVRAAGNLRHEDAIPALAEAMYDPSPMVANAAERALQRMGRAERRFGTLDEI